MNRLQELIRRLPPGVEFLLVVTWAFGLAIFESILWLSLVPPETAPDNLSAIGAIVHMLVVTGLLCWFLRIRGWTLERAGFEVTLRGTLWGGGLLAGISGLVIAAEVLAQFLNLELTSAMSRYASAASLDMQVAFVAAVVGGAYEEIFVAGYVITLLSAARGPWTAVNVSTGLRVLYHLYQGPVAVLTIVPMGLLFGYVYVRTRKLWPLIVAHVLMDVIALVLIRR